MYFIMCVSHHLYTACFFFYIDFTTTVAPTAEPKSKTVAIAGAVVGVIIFLAVITIIACVIKRRRKKPLTLAGVTFTAVSMRDRIRAESMRALDESKVMSLFNPDDMKQLPLTGIEYIRDLGSGNFGLVFLGMYISNKNSCVSLVNNVLETYEILRSSG